MYVACACCPRDTAEGTSACMHSICRHAPPVEVYNSSACTYTSELCTLTCREARPFEPLAIATPPEVPVRSLLRWLPPRTPLHRFTHEYGLISVKNKVAVRRRNCRCTILLHAQATTSTSAHFRTGRARTAARPSAGLHTHPWSCVSLF